MSVFWLIPKSFKAFPSEWLHFAGFWRARGRSCSISHRVRYGRASEEVPLLRFASANREFYFCLIFVFGKQSNRKKWYPVKKKRDDAPKENTCLWIGQQKSKDSFIRPFAVHDRCLMSLVRHVPAHGDDSKLDEKYDFEMIVVPLVYTPLERLFRRLLNNYAVISAHIWHLQSKIRTTTGCTQHI